MSFVEPVTNDTPELVCVLCGELWEPSYKNRCECGGFCTWGLAQGAQPSSWNEDGTPKPPPVVPDVSPRNG